MTQTGPTHHGWKGDDATMGSKRARARRRYALGPCEQCGEPGTDRHHIDGNTGNNASANIAILCRGCHIKLDGRLDRIQKLSSEKRLAQTHCKRGHEYTPENTYVHRGKRACRICKTAARERWRAR